MPPTRPSHRSIRLLHLSSRERPHRSRAAHPGLHRLARAGRSTSSKTCRLTGC
jgi:hypothetical protein